MARVPMFYVSAPDKSRKIGDGKLTCLANVSGGADPDAHEDVLLKQTLHVCSHSQRSCYCSHGTEVSLRSLYGTHRSKPTSEEDCILTSTMASNTATEILTMQQAINEHLRTIKGQLANNIVSSISDTRYNGRLSEQLASVNSQLQEIREGLFQWEPTTYYGAITLADTANPRALLAAWKSSTQSSSWRIFSSPYQRTTFAPRHSESAAVSTLLFQRRQKIQRMLFLRPQKGGYFRTPGRLPPGVQIVPYGEDCFSYKIKPRVVRLCVTDDSSFWEMLVVQPAPTGITSYFFCSSADADEIDFRVCCKDGITFASLFDAIADLEDGADRHECEVDSKCRQKSKISPECHFTWNITSEQY